MNEEKCGECVATGNTPTKKEQTLSADTTKLVGVYGLRNKINGKWYIGQSTDIYDRWKNAYEKLKCKNQPKIYQALSKYGYKNFERIIIEQCDSVNWIIDYREMHWIRYYNSVKNGYNLKSGGSSGKHSDETKKKISDTLKKKGIKPIITDLVRKKMAENALGRKFSTETRIRMSISAKNKPPMAEITKSRMSRSKKNISEETREKLRNASKLMWEQRKFNSTSLSINHGKRGKDK